MGKYPINVWIPHEKFANHTSAWFNGFKEGVQKATEYGQLPPPVNLQNPEKLMEADKIAAVAGYPTGYVGQAVLILCYAPVAYLVGKTICNVADKYFAYQKALAELRATKDLHLPQGQSKTSAPNTTSQSRKEHGKERKNQKWLDRGISADRGAQGNVLDFDFASVDEGITEALD